MNNYVMALFASGTTNFDYMGLGPLSDAISAIATETATSNGNITYTMEMDYPINGRLANQLVEGNLIKAQVSKTPGDYMIFEINETLKSDDRTITVYCDAYANRILRMSFDNGGKFGSFGNVQQALNAARAQMTGIQSDFTLSSGIGTSLNMSGVTSKNTLPTTYQDFNAYLDAIMDKVQGNVRFGVNSIQIVSDRGRDITDTVLRDDKNTNGISIKVDTSNIVNRIIPMLPVKDKDGNVTQETKVGKIVTSSVAFKFINFYAGQVVSLDTQDLANSYFNRTNCDRPTTTATVQTSMLDEDLTDIRLFDRVQVYSSKIGYQAKLKVSERAFDILAGAVSEFKLGSSSVTIFNSQTSVVNAVNSAVQSAQYAAITADGKNTAYYEGSNPNNPKENDLWFHSVDGVNQIDQYVNGNWVTIVSDSLGAEINKKVDQLGAEATSAVAKAEEASSNAKATAAKFDDTNQKADQALGNAISAEASASSAVAKAESTASEFGKVSQKTDSAFSNAMSAQNAASSAVSQASSAAADSKDAKQIAGAVKQSYKTLTDGSTMTIAELQSGLAVKLTKSDLNGYATQDWSQNQIKLTADGINGAISSVKNTVDSQTTSINDLKADSNGFRDQFTTVNNTLGKQTTDISALQVSSKELVSNFDSLSTANGKNEHSISELQQDSKGFSSTLLTVQNDLNNLNVGGRNYFLNSERFTITPSGIANWDWRIKISDSFWSNSDRLKSNNIKISFTLSAEKALATDFNSNLYFGASPWYGKPINYPAGTTAPQKYELIISITDSAFKADNCFIRFQAKDTSDFPFILEHAKLEVGTLFTDWSPATEDLATVTAVSKLSQTVDGMQTDISKKIEQKDLNGYATETWSQNQIKMTADGINGAISSVKNTVDEHTTNIHDIQADSKEFKSQFTTYKDTVDRHNKDISTLQRDSKSLSSNFDSLDSDNKTNQHNIGELQQSSKEFNSTLLTVQTQVTNSAVGTNLLTGTHSDWQSYTGTGWLNDNTFTLTTDNLDANTNYTFSVQIKSATGTWHGEVVATNSNGKSYIIGDAIAVSNGTTTSTFNISSIVSLTFRPHVSSSSLSTATTVQWRHEKLEKGSLATDWCANPADNATVTAVSSISQTIDKIQGTIINKADKSQITQLSDQITSTVGQISGVNLIPNSDFSQGKQYWHLSDNASIHAHGWKYTDGVIVLDQSDTTKDTVIDITVSPNTDYTFSCNMYGSLHVFLVPMKDTTAAWIPVDDDYQDNFHNLAGTDENTPRQSFTLKRTSGQTRRLRLILRAEAGTARSVFTKFQLEEGKVAHAWGPSDIGLASFSQISQLKDDISLRVEKAGVINAINISNEGTEIYGNKLHITAATYIDNAVIKDAMIAELNASKLHAGRIDASQIDVYNIDGSKINAYSITADKIQAGAMLIAMNSTLQTLKIGTDGLYTTNNGGTSIGKIHANNLTQHPENWGLDMDLSSTGQYMAWGAQNEGDPTGGYVIKFGWTRNGSASDFGMPWGGFWFNDNVMLHKNLRFDGGGVDVAGAYQLMKFAWIEMNGTKYPFFGSSNLKAGWLFGSNETYLVRGGGVINASKILGVLNGQSYKFIKSLNPDGSVKVYTDVHF